jgi:hypothetical protein
VRPRSDAPGSSSIPCHTASRTGLSQLASWRWRISTHSESSGPFPTSMRIEKMKGLARGPWRCRHSNCGTTGFDCAEASGCEGPTRQPTSPPTSRVGRTGRRPPAGPRATAPSDRRAAWPAANRSSSRSPSSDRFAVSPAAKTTPPLTRRSSPSGRRREPTLAPRPRCLNVRDERAAVALWRKGGSRRALLLHRRLVEWARHNRR